MGQKAQLQVLVEVVEGLEEAHLVIRLVVSAMEAGAHLEEAVHLRVVVEAFRALEAMVWQEQFAICSFSYGASAHL